MAMCGLEAPQDTSHLPSAFIILPSLLFIEFHRKSLYWKLLYSAMIFENESKSFVNCECVNIAAGILVFDAEEKGTELQTPEIICRRKKTSSLQLFVCFA